MSGLLACVVLVCAISIMGSLERVGRPFNGFLLRGNMIVAPVGPTRWSRPENPAPYRAQLIAIDGKPVTGVAEALAAAEANEGRSLTYLFRLGDQTLTRAITVVRFTTRDYFGLFADSLFNGLAFLTMGFLVAYLRPQLPAARAMLLLSVNYGMSFILSLADLDHPNLRNLHAVVHAAAPFSVIYLVGAFPTPQPWSQRLRVRVLLLVSATLLALADITLYHLAPAFWVRYFDSSLLWLGPALLLGSVLLWRQSRTAPNPLAREKIKVVALGAAVAFAIPAAATLGTYSAGAEVSPNLFAATTWIFPAALAYAIIKRDLFEIDVFLRQAIAYFALSAAVFFLYAGVVAVLSRGFYSLQLTGSPWFTLIFTLATVVLTRSLWGRLQAWVDRIFFRTRFDYAEITQSVSQALTRTLDMNEITGHVQAAVAQTMAPISCRLYTQGPGDGSLRCTDRGTPPLELETATGEALAAGQILDPAAFALLLGRPLPREVALLIPLRFEDRLEGVLLLGPKRSGAAYGPRDLELLRTLANQTATALRNASSYLRVTELLASLERRVEERTRELTRSHDEIARAYASLRDTQTQLVQAEKLASLGTLVAGVAHEINNPVSFIISGLDLIRQSIDELRELLEHHLAGNEPDPPSLRALRQQLDHKSRLDALEHNASICQEGAARLARIVADLRTFSRPGGAPREPADLHETLERALRLLHGEYKHRITIERRYANLPPVVCDVHQMGQVFVNLLSNAIQAIDGNGTVCVRTRCDDESVQVEIEDTGHGMEEAVLARVFDPFFSTKEVGKGIGLGLGICRSLVTAHGGDIRARSRPGQGSVFTVTLPINGVPDEQERSESRAPTGGHPRCG